MSAARSLPVAGSADGAGPTAAQTPEDRGLRRDDVRLLVSRADGHTLARFRDLPDALEPGDLVVVNNSATVAGQLDARSHARGRVVLHLAAELDDGTRVIEIRTAPDASRPVLDARPGERFVVGRAAFTLVSPYPDDHSSPTGSGTRLWRARVLGDLGTELRDRGRPIAYGYLERRYPLEAYQSVFATEPGSAEMPSAGRPFSAEMIARMVGLGIGLTTITLHTGVSSQETHEGPQPERFAVSTLTARLVNATRAEGGRVVAVGTTVTRALESAVDTSGEIVAASGWTDRIIDDEHPARVVTGLVTGWHDPEASHLALVESVAGRALTAGAYDAARAAGLLWHEFGDSALLLPILE